MGLITVIILLWFFGFFGCCDGCKCSNHDYNEYDYNEYDYIPYTSNYKDCPWCKREFDTTNSESEKDPSDAKKVYCSKECLDRAERRSNIVSKVFSIGLITFYALFVIYYNIAKFLRG